MAPRPAPDLDERRARIVRAAREVAATEGWSAVTMRRLANEVGATQPVLYSAFPGGRQAVVDAVALDGFSTLTAALEQVAPEPLARMHAYVDFAVANPSRYEAMFSMPSGLEFGVETTPEPLLRAFAAVRDAFPAPDDTRAEVAWASLHGLTTLLLGDRLPAERADARLALLHDALTAR